ncbi:MAG: hypothetical protein CMJ52_00915 [Planctomycetaceae bacterium]|nr:hypothetical protein [Planctomycetaceae bacterium]
MSNRLLSSSPILGTRLLVVSVVAVAVSAATAQSGLGAGDADRSESLAVAPVDVAAATQLAADAEGRESPLARIREAIESRLTGDLAATRKFRMVTRSRLDAVLAEQSLAASGFVDADDPSTAKSLRIAGVRWLAVPRIIDFEDLTRKRGFDGIERTVERRTIRIGLSVEILDTTTGVVGETATVTLERTDTVDENDRALPKGGDATNRLLGEIASEVSQTICCRVLDVAYPASVLAVGDGVVTFNRGDGGCVESGSTWIVSSRGEPLVDPDTGASLGYDERERGAVVVSNVGPRFSRARITAGGAGKGDVIRPAPSGWSPPADYAAASALTGSPTERARPASPRASDESGGLASLGPVAVFVRGNVEGMPSNTATALAASIGGALAAEGLAAVRPADIVESLRPGDADREIESDASLVRLAAAVGARSVMLVDLATMDRQIRRVEVNGTRTSMRETVLRGGWRLLASGTGAADAGDYFTVRAGSMASRGGGAAQVEIDEDLAGRLYTETARTIAGQLRADASRLSAGGDDAGPDLGYLEVDVVIEGLSVPEIVPEGEDGWRITGTDLPVLAGGAEVALDGFVVCTTPCGIAADRGPHRMTITRNGAEAWSRSIMVLQGTESTPQRISVGLRLDDEERRRWIENAAIFEGLKRDAALTAAEVAQIRGFAQFLRQSGFRIDRRRDESIRVDTDQAPVIEQWNSFWNRW